MALDSKALARIKHGQAAERADMIDTHGAQKRQLSHMMEQARKREVEEARKNGGRSSTRLRSEEAAAQERVKEHAKLKAKQDAEYDDLKRKHAKEISDAEKGHMPAKRAAPVGMNEVQDQWGHMSGHEQDEYRRVVQHFGRKRKDVDTAADARRDRHSRYNSSAMQASLERDRLEKHGAEDRKQQSALADLRRRVERRRGVA
jgi:hypothetical protein